MVRRVVIAALEVIEAGFGVVDIATVGQRIPERDCRAGGSLRREKRGGTLLSYVGAVNTRCRPLCRCSRSCGLAPQKHLYMPD